MASDGDAGRLVDPLLQVPVALAIAIVLAAAAWVRRRASPPGCEDPGPIEPIGRGARVAALAIGLVAVALRVPWSGPEPMDHLEYALVVETDLAESGWEVLVNRIGIEQAHQPLSRVPIALARRAGLRPEVTRWFQLAAWIVALAAAWRWCRLLASSWTGAIAPRAAAVALASFAWVAWSPLGARYGFDATPYGLFVALAWWGAVALHEVASGNAGWRWAAIGCVAAAFYTHYVELWFFAGTAAIAWLATRELAAPARARARVDLLMVACGFALTVVPWLPAMRWGAALFRRYVSREVDLYAMDFPWWEQLRETMRIATGWPGWASAVALVFAASYLALRGDRVRRVGVVAASAGLAPFLVFRAVQQFQYHGASGGTYFGARHVLPFLPLLVLPIVAAAEAVLPRRTAARGRLPSAALLLAAPPLVALVSAVAGSAAVQRPDIRGAARYVRDHLQDGDAVGVLPRFFYSALVVDEVSAGRVGFQEASGFARLPLGRAESRPDPLVWLPADDREFPLPAALENRAFRRVWVIDFQEREFGLLELAPGVSRAVTAHMDSAHHLVERRTFEQLVLSLYALDGERESWDGGPWVIDEASWRGHARDVSWTVDGGRVTYRIDLPSPSTPRAAELVLTFPAAEEGGAPTDVRLTVGGAVDESFAVAVTGGVHTVRFDVPAGAPLWALLEYPGVVARAPSRVEMRPVVHGG